MWELVDKMIHCEKHRFFKQLIDITPTYPNIQAYRLERNDTKVTSQDNKSINIYRMKPEGLKVLCLWVRWSDYKLSVMMLRLEANNQTEHGMGRGKE